MQLVQEIGETIELCSGIYQRTKVRSYCLVLHFILHKLNDIHSGSDLIPGDIGSMEQPTSDFLEIKLVPSMEHPDIVEGNTIPCKQYIFSLLAKNFDRQHELTCFHFVTDNELRTVHDVTEKIDGLVDFHSLIILPVESPGSDLVVE